MAIDDLLIGRDMACHARAPRKCATRRRTVGRAFSLMARGGPGSGAPYCRGCCRSHCGNGHLVAFATCVGDDARGCWADRIQRVSGWWWRLSHQYGERRRLWCGDVLRRKLGATGMVARWVVACVLLRRLQL